MGEALGVNPPPLAGSQGGLIDMHRLGGVSEGPETDGAAIRGRGGLRFAAHAHSESLWHDGQSHLILGLP